MLFRSKAENEAEALDSWNAAKKTQKGYESRTEMLTSVSKALPALMRAAKVQSRSAKFGFTYGSVEKTLADLKGEISELEAAIASKNSLEIEDELGDVLFAAANLSSLLKCEAEEALCKSTEKFIRRVAKCEEYSKADGMADLADVLPDKLDKYWKRAKKQLLLGTQS